jgi:hypothetical protein
MPTRLARRAAAGCACALVGLLVVGCSSAVPDGVLATYYAPGSKNYIGGQHVEPTDQIIVIKQHGDFGFSGPPPGQAAATPTRWPTTMVLQFYNATTGKLIGFTAGWAGDAPDLGVGQDPGIGNRELAVQRWDLRLVGTPAVRTD